ncbi:MAG: methyltransferase domain-containing protein [Theionarchaea archaeon]|nr:MAG: hypothetical protein AYK19_22165 [Theionarchaea archaeon DG-70-1]MBU7010055.1 methyltransferase domain-containing protein [Theionarchaea archaeon]
MIFEEKEKLNRHIGYLRNNPVFASDLFHLLSLDSSSEGAEKIKEFFQELDLATPHAPKFPLHKGYQRYEERIKKIIQKPEVYSLDNLMRKRNYLSQRSVREGYEKGAEKYDQTCNKYWPFGREELIAALDIQPGERVLEIGVGTGLNFEHYPETCKVTGIDITESMLDIGKKRIEELGKDNIRVKKMDAHEMSFSDNYFDKVVSMYGICVLEDPVKAIQEASRVSKKGGIMGIIDVVKSPIKEVELLQYLLRPIQRELDHIYLEDFPVGTIPYDGCFDLLSVLEETNFNVEKKEYFTSINWVAMFLSINSK